VLWNRRFLRRIDLTATAPHGGARTGSRPFPTARTGTLTLRVVTRDRVVAIDAVVVT